MTATNWRELALSLAGKYLPGANTSRNAVAAVVSLYRRLNLAPLTVITSANYTLKESDCGRIIYCGAGSIVNFPLTLPTGFRCSFRNETAGNATIYPSGFELGYTLVLSSGPVLREDSVTLLPGGTAELAYLAYGVAELHGKLAI